MKWLCRWQAGEQGDCSVSCGMGVAVRSVRCVQYEGGVERLVEENRCDPGNKPPVTAPCFTQVCSFHWDVPEWSEVNDPDYITTQPLSNNLESVYSIFHEVSASAFLIVSLFSNVVFGLMW